MHIAMRFTQRLFAIILIAALLLGAMPVTPARAAPSIVVSTNSDSGAGSLRQAILDVDSGGTITFAAGLSGDTIYLGNQLIISKGLTIDASALASPITLDTSETDRLIYIDGNYTVVLKHLALNNGSTLAQNQNEAMGGAIRSQGPLTVQDCTFTHNRGGGHGGAIYSVGLLTVHDSIFTDNKSFKNGGAIYAEGGLAIYDSTFSENEAQSGGALISWNYESIVQRSSFNNNKTSGYGTDACFSDTAATVVNSTFRNTTATLSPLIYVNDGGAHPLFKMLNSTLYVDGINSLAITNGITYTLINNIFAGSGYPGAFYQWSRPDPSTHPTADQGSGYNIYFSASPYAQPPATDMNGESVGPHLTWNATTGTFMPDANSKVLGAGNATICAAAAAGKGVGGVDQRGKPRAAGSCSMGAVEPQLYKIEGAISNNLNGVVVTATGSGGYSSLTKSSTPTAGDDGKYAVLDLPENWVGSLSAAKEGFNFSADIAISSPMSGDLSGKNFTATAITWTISGSAGVPGVQLAYDDGGAKSVTSGPGGAYSLTVSYGWSGAITPTLSGYVFTPASRDYSSVKADTSSGNDYAAESGVTISGVVKVGKLDLEGVSVSNGTTTVLTDSSGAWSFTLAKPWSGTITPSKLGYTMNPAQKVYAAQNADASANFTAVAKKPTAITLSDTRVLTDSGVQSPVGTLGTVDGNAYDTFAYATTSINGKDCSGNQSISFTQAATWELKISSNPNFINKSTYSVCLRSTDSTGNTVDKQFTILVAAMHEDFEGTPDNDWTETGSTAYQGTQKNAGSSALKLGSAGGSVSRDIVWLTGAKNDTLTLSWYGYANSKQATSSCTAYIRFKDGGGATLADSKGGKCASATGKWAMQTLKIKAPVSFSQISVFFVMQASTGAEVYIDDIWLTR